VYSTLFPNAETGEVEYGGCGPQLARPGWLVQTIRGTPGYSALVGRVLCAKVS
jgi:hypothetical protein